MAFYELNAHFSLLRLMLNLPTDTINGIKCNKDTKVELIDISIIKYESKEKLDTWNYARSNIANFKCFLVNYFKNPHNTTQMLHNYKKVDIPIYNINYAIHDLKLTIEDNIRTNNIKKLPKRKKRLKVLKKIKCLNDPKDCPDILGLDNVDNLLVSDLKITNNEDEYYKDKEKTEFNKIIKYLNDKFNEDLQTTAYNINHLDILNIKHLIEYIFKDFETTEIYMDLMTHINGCIITYMNTYNGTQQQIMNELGEFTNPDLKYDDDLDDLYKDFIYNKLFNLDYKNIIRLLFKIYKNSYRILGIYYLRYLIYSNLYNLDYTNISIETYNHELYDSDMIDFEHRYVAQCAGVDEKVDDNIYTITGGKYSVSNINIGNWMNDEMDNEQNETIDDRLRFGTKIIHNSIYANLYRLARDGDVSTRGLPIKYIDVYEPENMNITKIYSICYNIIHLLNTDTEFNESIKIFAFNNNNDLSAGMIKYQNSIYILANEEQNDLKDKLMGKIRSLMGGSRFDLDVHKDYYDNDIFTLNDVSKVPLLNVIILNNVIIINSEGEEKAGKQKKKAGVKLTLEEPSFITFDTQKHGLIQLISYYARQPNLTLSPDKYYIYNKYSKNILSNKLHNLNLSPGFTTSHLKNFSNVRYYSDTIEEHYLSIMNLNPIKHAEHAKVAARGQFNCVNNNYPIRTLTESDTYAREQVDAYAQAQALPAYTQTQALQASTQPYVAEQKADTQPYVVSAAQEALFQKRRLQAVRLDNNRKIEKANEQQFNFLEDRDKKNGNHHKRLSRFYKSQGLNF